MKEFFRKTFSKVGEEWLTIPNILSYVRLLLIPVIVILFVNGYNILTLVFVLVSTLTDIVDGFIARRFNMVTDFGKFIDPVADKATQLTVFICLITKFPLMLLPFVVLLVKEIGSLLLRVAVYKKNDIVEGAHWHGKMSTGIVILVIVLHLGWWDAMPAPISDATILFSTIFMIYSGLLYTLEGIDLLKNGKRH